MANLINKIKNNKIKLCIASLGIAGILGVSGLTYHSYADDSDHMEYGKKYYGYMHKGGFHGHSFMDANDDGTIETAEIKAFFDGMFATGDQDQSGGLNPAEIQLAMHDAIFQKFDVNKDQTLNQEEFQGMMGSMMQSGKKQGRKNRHVQGIYRMLGYADSGQDGELNPNEIDAIIQMMEEHH